METNIDKRALYSLSYGLYLVSSRKGDKLNGQVANAVMQVTSDPVCIVACLHKDNLTTEYVRDSGVFSVSILEEDTPMTFIGTFGFKCGRDIDKFCKCSHEIGVTGAPLVMDHTVAAIEARVIREVEVFTHVMFFGEVAASRIIKTAKPLTYAFYHEIKKGKSPKNAPTFSLNEVK
ncbi:MAG: flavin reductase family protein [Thermovirgaceae bacterium]|nr:flavin reductase family protein [Thermovirgaceae bacterium]